MITKHMRCIKKWQMKSHGFLWMALSSDRFFQLSQRLSNRSKMRYEKIQVKYFEMEMFVKIFTLIWRPFQHFAISPHVRPVHECAVISLARISNWCAPICAWIGKRMTHNKTDSWSSMSWDSILWWFCKEFIENVSLIICAPFYEIEISCVYLISNDDM